MPGKESTAHVGSIRGAVVSSSGRVLRGEHTAVYFQGEETSHVKRLFKKEQTGGLGQQEGDVDSHKLSKIPRNKMFMTLAEF